MNPPHEHSVVVGQRLGRIPNPPHKLDRLLSLSKYLTALPSPPTSCDRSEGITDWPMYLNDKLGDCAIACPSHQVEIFTKAATGTAREVTDADVLTAYESQGYSRSAPATDQGCAPLSVLDYWRHTGIGGDTLYAYATVDPSDLNMVKTALGLFYGVYLGVGLPLTAQSQDVWDVVDAAPALNGAGTWGGHAIPAIAYDEQGLAVVTWGATKKMTWKFFSNYCDEVYACLPNYFPALPTHPLDNGLDFATLQQDMFAVGAINE